MQEMDRVLIGDWILINFPFETFHPHRRTSISRPSSSWLDDYIDYLNVPSCCRVTSDGEFCPSSNKQCASCDRTIEGIRPDRETFTEFFEWYLSDLPDENCAKAGRAAYAAVSGCRLSLY